MLGNCCGKVEVFLGFMGLKEEDNIFRIFGFGVTGIRWWCTGNEKMADLVEEAGRCTRDRGGWSASGRNGRERLISLGLFGCEEREKIERDKEGVSEPGIQQVQFFEKR